MNSLAASFRNCAGGGLLENTLVIVTSDHGEHFQERGFSGHGASVYRREIHVPLLIFPPGEIPGRRVVTRPVSLRQLPATIVDMLGITDRSPFPGNSLASLFRSEPGAASSTVEPILSEVGHQSTIPPSPEIPSSLSHVHAITLEREVYIRNGHGEEELYDRLTDPEESDNRIDDLEDPQALDPFRKLLDQTLESEEEPET